MRSLDIILGRLEVEALNIGFMDMTSAFHYLLSTVFDPGLTYLYICTYHALWLGFSRKPLSLSLCIATPIGDSLDVDLAYR